MGVALFLAELVARAAPAASNSVGAAASFSSATNDAHTRRRRFTQPNRPTPWSALRMDGRGEA